MSIKICKEEETGGAHDKCTWEGYQVNKDKKPQHLLSVFTYNVSDWIKLAISVAAFKED